jgi:hypothetical protein
MFSYPPGLLQMRTAKRAENRFNGVAASSSGEAQSRATEWNHIPAGRSALPSLDSREPALSEVEGRLSLIEFADVRNE